MKFNALRLEIKLLNTINFWEWGEFQPPPLLSNVRPLVFTVSLLCTSGGVARVPQVPEGGVSPECPLP